MTVSFVPLTLGLIASHRPPVPLPLLQQTGSQFSALLPDSDTSPTTALIFPDASVIPSSTLIAAEDAYITPEFDAAFLVVIPILFGGALFGFWKLLRLFASAF